MLCKKSIIVFILVLLELFSISTLADINKAKVLVKKGSYEQAAEYLESMRKKEGETEDILVLLGTSYYKMRKLYWAEECFHKCIDSYPQNADVYLMLFEIQDRFQKYEEAIDTLAGLMKIQGRKGILIHKTGETYLKTYNKKQKTEFKEKAIDAFEQALAADKQMYASALEIGQIYLKDKEYLKAAGYFDKALVINPELPGIKEQRDWCGFEGNQIQGNDYFKQKAYHEAIAAYKTALGYKPDYALNVKLANAYYLVKDYQKALKVLDQAVKQTRQSAEAFYLQGLIYYDIKEDEKAEKCFNDCIRLKPRDAKAYYYLGRIKDNAEDYPNAVRNYKKAVSFDDKDAQYHKSLAMVYIKIAEYKQAVDELEIAENLNKEYDFKDYIDHCRTLYLVQQGHEKYDKDQYKDALDYYEDAADIMDLAQIHLSMGNTLLKLDKFKDAVKHLEKALKLDKDIIEIYQSLALAYRRNKQFTKADHIYEQLQGLTRDNPEIYYKSGLSYEERGDFQQAVQMYLSALLIDKKYQKARERLSHVFYNKGALLYNQGEFQEARTYFSKGLQYTEKKDLFRQGIQNCDLHLKVEYINQMYEQAELLFKKTRYKEASEIFRKIYEIKPELIDARISQALCYYQLNNYEASEMVLDELTKKYPDNVKVIVELAFLYLEMDKQKKAENLLNIAQRKDSRYFKTYYIKGLLQDKKNNIDDAVRYYKQSIELNPRFHEAHIDLGNLYYKQKQYTKAGTEYFELLKYHPYNLVANYNLGVVFLKKGQYDKALKKFIVVKGEMEQYPFFHFHIGKSYYYLGQYGNALRYMQKAMDDDTRILYVWGLANIYIKLISIIPKKKEEYKKQALKLLDICMQNTEDNKISLLSRRAILKLNPNEKLLYTYRLPIDVHYSPVMVGDYSYVYSDKRQAFLFIKKESEDIIWEYREPAPPSCQFVLGENFYCGLENGQVIALDRNTGELIWKYPGYFTDIKTVDKYLITLSGKSDQVLCLYKGRENWDINLDEDEKHYIITKGNDLICFNKKLMMKIDPGSGKVQWKYDLKKEKGKISSAGLSEKFVFVNIEQKDDYLITINKQTGKKMWEKKIPYQLQFPPIVYANRIICLLKNATVYTFFQDGKKEWQKEFDEDIVSGLVHGNKLYISLDNDKIYGLRIRDGKIIWQYKMPEIKQDQLFLIYYVQ